MKSIVLLSAGLDSTVNFCIAHQKSELCLALTFDYGQRAARSEILNAKRICEKYKVPHQVIGLPWLKAITNTALVNESADLPKLKSAELDVLEKTKESAKNVWVPNRNGVFINIAASFAESLGANQIVVGFNAEEAVTFPDNSENYVNQVNGSLNYSTLSHPQVVSYTRNLNKKEIVILGHEVHAPFEWMWSCYESGETPCKQCESCLRYDNARGPENIRT